MTALVGKPRQKWDFHGFQVNFNEESKLKIRIVPYCILTLQAMKTIRNSKVGPGHWNENQASPFFDFSWKVRWFKYNNSIKSEFPVKGNKVSEFNKLIHSWSHFLFVIVNFRFMAFSNRHQGKIGTVFMTFFTTSPIKLNFLFKPKRRYNEEWGQSGWINGGTFKVLIDIPIFNLGINIVVELPHYHLYSTHSKYIYRRIGQYSRTYKIFSSMKSRWGRNYLNVKYWTPERGQKSQ